MNVPRFNAHLSQPFAIFVGAVALSYFSHKAWWSLSGLCFILGYWFLATEHYTLGDSFLIFSVILFVLGIVFSGWAWF